MVRGRIVPLNHTRKSRMSDDSVARRLGLSSHSASEALEAERVIDGPSADEDEAAVHSDSTDAPVITDSGSDYDDSLTVYDPKAPPCQTCKKEPKNVTLSPCGHECCNNCANWLHACSICQRVVHKRIPITHR